MYRADVSQVSRDEMADFRNRAWATLVSEGQKERQDTKEQDQHTQKTKNLEQTRVESRNV